VALLVEDVPVQRANHWHDVQLASQAISRSRVGPPVRWIVCAPTRGLGHACGPGDRGGRRLVDRAVQDATPVGPSQVAGVAALAVGPPSRASTSAVALATQLEVPVGRAQDGDVREG